MPRLVAVLGALLVVALVSAGAADAKRKVPPLFVGASFDGPMLAAPDDLQARQFPKMSRAGVESVRVAFHWGEAQPVKDGPIDLSATDRLVGLAAARHIEVMPHIIIAPAWNRWDLSDQLFAPPSDPEKMAVYVRAVVARYGSDGTFWAENPQLPKVPIRYWQFWNEPHLPYQWTIPKNVSWSETYVWEMGYFYRAVKAVDPRAQVVLAGLTNFSWVSLRELYDNGIKGLFDVAAIHPYTKSANGVVELVRRFRAVMSGHGDGRKPIFVTELGLPASRGRSKSKNSLQTTDRGMARYLEQVYAALAKARAHQSTRVSRAYWYTWGSEYRGNIFRYTGLFRYTRRGTPTAKPAYSAYVRTARRLEGCTRTSAGVCR